jgi:type II secretory pathway component GspD/PulD (secretin)
MLVFVSGCHFFERYKNSETELPNFENYEFEKSSFVGNDVFSVGKETVTVRFEGIELKNALSMLTEQTGRSIIWSSSLDHVEVYGTFFNQPLSVVLESICRRASCDLSENSGVYYLGVVKDTDLVSAVVRMLPVESSGVIESFQSNMSELGHISVIGGSIYVCDRSFFVNRFLSDIERLRRNLEHSYIAEVFFIRVKEDDFIQVTGDLQIQQIDVFSSTTNLDEMFKMFVDADAGRNFASVEQRPVLYLSEGRKAVFEVGTEIVREKKSVSDQGTTQTTGYERFNDGLNLSLNLIRVSDMNYSVDFDLSVSTFDAAAKTSTTIPSSDKSSLQLPGLLVQDSKIYYVGSLKRKDIRKGYSLFGVDSGRSNDLLTVWFRVRELKR